MVFCHDHNWSWDEIYNWNVTEFKEIYHALQRNDARLYLRNFSALGQAQGGDKKSIKKFVDEASLWLPNWERNGGAGNADDFIGLVRKGLKLKE